MNRLFSSLLFAISGVTVLYLLSIYIQPIPINISEVQNFDEREVRVEGEIIDISVTDQNYQVIKIKGVGKDSSSTTIFSEECLNVSYGDIIRVCGRVERYKGLWEIVASPDKITILNHSNPQSVPLWKLSLDIDQYKDRNINIAGSFIKISENKIRLYDKNKEYSIQVVVSPSQIVDIDSNSCICVNGRVFYNKQSFSYYVLADQVMRCD